MTDELSRLRARIDLLDRRIAALLGRRLALAREIGRRGRKAVVRDPRRERQVLANAAAAAGRPAFRAPVKKIYAEIMKQCRRAQA